MSLGDMSYSPDEYIKSQITSNPLKIDIDWYIT